MARGVHYTLSWPSSQPHCRDSCPLGATSLARGEELEVIYGTAGCSYRIQCSRLNWLSRPSRVNNGDSVGGREETTKGKT